MYRGKQAKYFFKSGWLYLILFFKGMLCTYNANEVQFRFHCHKSKMVLSILDRRISNIRVNYPVHSKSLSVDVPTVPTHLHSQTVQRIQQKNTPFRQKIQNLCSPNFEMLFLPLYPTIVLGRPISILKKNNSLLGSFL